MDIPPVLRIFRVNPVWVSLKRNAAATHDMTCSRVTVVISDFGDCPVMYCLLLSLQRAELKFPLKRWLYAFETNFSAPIHWSAARSSLSLPRACCLPIGTLAPSPTGPKRQMDKVDMTSCRITHISCWTHVSRPDLPEAAAEARCRISASPESQHLKFSSRLCTFDLSHLDTFGSVDKVWTAWVLTYYSPPECKNHSPFIHWSKDRWFQLWLTFQNISLSPASKWLQDWQCMDEI